MYRRFVSEGDIHDTLDCVPLAARRKLDLAGLKVSLADWQSLPFGTRLALCERPCESAAEIESYRLALHALGLRLTPIEVDVSAWRSATTPTQLAAFLSDEDWQKLDDEERFALVKLADTQRNSARLPALLAELGLGPASPVPDDANRCGP